MRARLTLSLGGGRPRLRALSLAHNRIHTCEPLYTLVNPTDDAAMKITHVLRGEDLLSSTPRQIALYEAMIDLGVFDGPVPQFGHLPYVMGEGNKKLSKRDPESSLQMYRDRGYLPEALTNYLALLGWSPGGDVEFFSKEQMAETFSLERVNPNPARFDVKKCTAINGDWIRYLVIDDLVERLVPLLDMLQHADASGRVNFQTFKSVVLHGLKATTAQPNHVVSAVASEVASEPTSA